MPQPELRDLLEHANKNLFAVITMKEYICVDNIKKNKKINFQNVKLQEVSWLTLPDFSFVLVPLTFQWSVKMRTE